MRLTTRQTGIISYAGLEEGALWASAKRMFAQSDESVPDRFRSFLPIFPIELVQNMSYVGRRERNLAKVSPAGFSTDPDEYACSVPRSPNFTPGKTLFATLIRRGATGAAAR